MTTPTVECWFDYSSPFAYLGTTQVERVAAQAGGQAVFRPFFLGALFKTIGSPVVPLEGFSQAKQQHVGADLHRWADHWGVPFRFCSRFPLRTVEPLRLTLLVPDAARGPLVHAIMRACWVDDEDPTDRAVLGACLDRAGLDRALLDRTGETKQALFDATSALAARGGFGAPTFFVGDQLFWGQDRLLFVGKALGGWRPAAPGSTIGGEVAR